MRYLLLALPLFLVRDLNAQDLVASCRRMDSLNTAILLQKIPRAAAAARFRQLMGEIAVEAPRAVAAAAGSARPAAAPPAGASRPAAAAPHPAASPAAPIWDFPLRGYTYRAIGGTNGNGYSDKGYRYLDGNAHLAHPAHDIFITDKDQDQMDDRTGKPVDVLAVEDGVVIACCDTWDVHSPLRGGRYIWLYHPKSGLLTYYAHNRMILVAPGGVVRQGQKIAEVGRTGFNAYPHRSPTHLHFSSFRLVDGLPVPFNGYDLLKKAKTI
ncbi:M23 family metallopeptidase [Dinghuibacter silviterrae]|uniref:Peptidase M23-like protein n=1 Tax=Dinghuibacter silviterrae TaxID=1539049 RepID=A0A4R8DT42_9BACT|nr:M23 family metallopeptidase [Dinghuibacter silviterrae]TDX00321.1 peptidase M23-like protein [Dinghuibacter silviterrae]